MIKRGLISLFLLLLCIGSALAQDASQPLILIRTGDLWEWTGGPMLRQKTEWGYNSGLALSPLNDEVAYGSYATITTDAIKREGGFGGGSLPNNLWVITMQPSDLAYRPADQPADASFMSPGVPDKALIRSGAMWSPDATQIAWTEYDYAGDGTYRLMIYDKASATSRIVTTGLPQQYGQGAGLNGVWTDKGIVLYDYRYNDAIGQAQNSIIVIDPETGDTGLAATLEDITTGDDNLIAMLKVPMIFEGETQLGVLYVGGRGTSLWVVINLETGATQTVEHRPIVTTGDLNSAVVYAVPRVIDADSIGYDVYPGPDAPALALNLDDHNQIYQFALSPDGQAIAYQLYDPNEFEIKPTIYIWRNGSITTVPNTEFLSIINEFVWGSATWIAP